MEQLLVHELRQRAIVAAAEGNATARSDARYFDASADIIETLSSKLAAARRILSAADKGSPIYIAVQRVLDENSAWIAAPNPEVVKQIALAAGIAWMAAEPVPESLADMASSLAEARAECERLREALEDIGMYGCGMLNQPASLNEPNEAWLKKRIAEYERRALAALKAPTDA